MKRKQLLINSILLLILIVSFAVQYNATYEDAVEKQQASILNTELIIETTVKDSIEQLEIIQFMFQDRLLAAESEPVKLSPYGDNTYYFENKDKLFKSSLTGLINSDIDKDEREKEISIALSVNEAFAMIKQNIPDIKWIYYTSSNKFLNMYPYISKNEYTVTAETFNYDFYKVVAPENNPDRKYKWTKLYEDQVTGELMITISLPIYADDHFYGALSIDYAFKTLSNTLDKVAPKYHNYVVYNDYNEIVAKRFSDLDDEDIHIDLEELRTLDGKGIVASGNYLFSTNRLGRQPLYITTIIDKASLQANVFKQLYPVIFFVVASVSIVNLYYRSISINKKYEASERQFKTLFDQSPQIIIVMDYLGRVIDMNHFGLRFMGIDHEAALKLTYDDLPIWMNSDYVPNRLEQHKQIIEKEGRYRNDYQVVNYNNDVKNIIYNLIALKDEYDDVIQFVALGIDVTDQKDLQYRLENMTRTDILTQALNRRGIYDILEKSVHRLERKGYSFTILLCDIDFFKEVNDNYGHECGDEILVSLVSVMEKTIRQHDYIGRWGGEEFIVILEDVQEEEAFEIADRIRQNVSKTPFRCARNEDPIFINITIGLTKFDNGKDIKSNIASADKALYYGKKNGRNQTIRYSKI